MLSIILGFAAKLLAPVAYSAVSALAAYVGLMLKNRFHNALVDDAYKNVSDAALLASKEVGATVVESIKASASDGKLTKEDAAKVLADAVAKTKAIASNKAMALLKSQGVEVDPLINSLIESHVSDGLVGMPSFVKVSMSKELPPLG